MVKIKSTQIQPPTHHGEIGLLRNYCSQSNITSLKDFTFYSSYEPCVTCSGAMVWCELGRLVYSVSYDLLVKIEGSNIMIGSDEVFENYSFT